MEGQPICWVAACFRRCPGEGMPQDWAGLKTPKWGTAQILVGPHVTKTGEVFLYCVVPGSEKRIFICIKSKEIKELFDLMKN